MKTAIFLLNIFVCGPFLCVALPAYSLSLYITLYDDPLQNLYSHRKWKKTLLALISPDTPRTYHKWTRIWLEMVMREVKWEKSILGFRQKPTEWQKAVGVEFFSLPLALFCPASTNSFIIPRSWWVKGRFLQTETPFFFQFPNKGYVRKHVYCKDMIAFLFFCTITCALAPLLQ